MSYPVLYEKTERNFRTNGIGILAETDFCIVTEECNGIFELELRYPAQACLSTDLTADRIIMARPNPADGPQPFRIYQTERVLNDDITVYARHVSYDLSGYMVGPFTAHNAAEALRYLQEDIVPVPLDHATRFLFGTDITSQKELSVAKPSIAREVLRDIVDVYGGEYRYDRWAVFLHNARGQDRGTVIRYGWNMTGLEQSESVEEVYTHLYPFWTDSESKNLVQLTEKIYPSTRFTGPERILPLDFSGEWSTPPTPEQLRQAADRYYTAYPPGIPKKNLQISFQQSAYRSKDGGRILLEPVNLCDTVRISHEKMGISVKKQVVRTEYNVLQDRYESIEIGDLRKTLSTTISAMGANIIKGMTMGANTIKGMHSSGNGSNIRQ